jgi:hypothetical protein
VYLVKDAAIVRRHIMCIKEETFLNFADPSC